MGKVARRHRITSEISACQQNLVIAANQAAVHATRQQAAESRLRNRLHHRARPGWEDLGTLGTLSKISAQTLPPQARLADLRWYISADVDAYVKYKGPQHRFPDCNCNCGCSGVEMYPKGRLQPSQCWKRYQDEGETLKSLPSPLLRLLSVYT